MPRIALIDLSETDDMKLTRNKVGSNRLVKNLAADSSIYKSRLLTIILLTLLSMSKPTSAQHDAVFLNPLKPITFSLKPGESKIFEVSLKIGDVVDLNWLSNEDLQLEFDVLEPTDSKLDVRGGLERHALLFVAKKNGIHKMVITFSPTTELTETENISLEYKNKLNLPVGSRQSDIRRVNGYEIRILGPAIGKDGKSFVMISKGGKLVEVLRRFGGIDIGPSGFYFGDDLRKADTLAKKRSAGFISRTADKTGDRIPDVMINYVSGGAHCCEESYFFNLGSSVNLAELVMADFYPVRAVNINSTGELIFELEDAGDTCWQLPPLRLKFQDGRLVPAVDLMRKPIPGLSSLRVSAQKAHLLMGGEPYNGDEDGFGCTPYREGSVVKIPFWYDMINLLLSDSPNLAWQYFDLVWPVGKPGKAVFENELLFKLSNYRFWNGIPMERSRPANTKG